MAIILGHRERLLRSLENREVDRPPCFFRAEEPVRARLEKELSLSGEPGLIGHFDADALHLKLPVRMDYLKKSTENGTFYDIFGNKLLRFQHDSRWTDTVVEPVLKGLERPEEIDRIKWPDSGMIDLHLAVKQARQARETGLAVYGGAWASIFTHTKAMVGEEDFLAGLATDPELIACLVERVTKCYLEINEVYFSRCAADLDVFYFGSDFGTQNSMFVSREMFREIFMPSIASICEQARNSGLIVMYHSCGSISGIISDLIDCGVDILDPVQASAEGMDPQRLKKMFGGKIGFHGGISTQTLMPSATPEEVEQVVSHTIGSLGPLGYIIAPDQDLMEDVPTANIEAIYRAVANYRF
ncbi:MAG: hypothetical protein FVQ81_07930 [Candidatus Glassbacteria bacterium]|nr:hypothetical protein [Candidatus Glassbacteria bacterium]